MKSSGPDRPPLFARRSLPSERLGVRDPELVRQFAKMVAGIQFHPASRKLGENDAAAGIFRLSPEEILAGAKGRGEIDPLAYMDGWVGRRQADKRRGG